MRCRALAGFLAVIAISVSAAPASADPDFVLHHDVAIRIDPQAHRIDVVDRITIDGADVGIDAIRLALWLTPSRIEVDGAPVPLMVDDGVLRLPRGKTAPSMITVRYTGQLSPDGHVNADPPRSAPEAAIGSEGTFLPAGWLPRIEGGPGAATYRLSVFLPEDQVAIATGRLEHEHTGGNGTEAVFASEPPHAEPSLFAGPYTVRERLHGQIRLRTYFHEQADDLAETYLDAAAEYLDAFSAQIGAYPFASLAIVSSPFPVGLGFPGVTYVSRQILPLAFMRGRSLAHEILHNWWGSGVGVDYATGNWAEGLTTYMADYALAVAEGEDAARSMRYDWLRDFAALPRSGERPVVTFVGRDHTASQAIGYGKAAFIFHMLRQEVGEDTFDAAVRRFWGRHKLATAGWRDLQEAFEVTANRELGWFFDQWLERPGAPRVILNQAQGLGADDGAGGGHGVSITLSQDDEIYRLSVPVRVVTATTTVTERVWLDAAEVTVRLDVPDTPLTVIADPELDVFRRLHPEEAPPILRDVTLDPTTALLIATDSPEAERVAETLARRLLEAEPRRLAPGTGPAAMAPVLLVGTGGEVRAAIEALGVGPVPEAIAGHGAVQVWVGARAEGGRHAVVVVAAADAAALAVVQRPLAHYGRASYLAFQDSQALVIGAWPPDHGPMRIDLGHDHGQ
jgi:aminopeptidase N